MRRHTRSKASLTSTTTSTTVTDSSTVGPLVQVQQTSDEVLGLVKHLLRGWAGLALGVLNTLAAVTFYVCMKCRRRREVRRLLRDVASGRMNPYRRRRLLPLSDGSVVDLSDFESNIPLEDSVFIA